MNKRFQFGHLYREATAKVVDVEARTVEVAFSSETPVRRGGFFRDPFDEVLDHDPKSVRMGRLNDGAPVLMNHDSRDYVGVVESASIDSDRRGRAVVRFGKGKRASEVLQDVQDRILRNVSVGYRIHEGEVLKRKGEPDVLRVTDWEPMEISMAPVPADPTTQVGRADDDGPPTLIHLPEGDTVTQKDDPKPAGGDIVAISAAQSERVREEERKRLKEINAIARMYPHIPDIAESAEQALWEGHSIDKFRAHVLEILSKQSPGDLAPRLPEDRPKTELGLSSGDLRQYSVIRAIRAVMAMRGLDTDRSPGQVAPFEVECSNAVAEQLGQEPKGILIPYDVQQRTPWGIEASLHERAFQLGMTHRTPPMGVATTGTVAAALKGTELLASAFIEALRNASVALSAGAVPLPGLVGDVDIPKQTGLGLFGWVAEDVAAADSEVPIGVVSLAPKTINGPIPITRKLIKQSTPAVEQIVRNDLVMGAAEIIDVGILRGSGAAGQPLGIRGTTGVNTVTLADAVTPRIATFAEMVQFETEVGTDNALSDGAVYMFPWAIAGALKTTVVDAGSGRFVFQDGEVNGYRAIPTSQLDTDQYLFGSFAQVLLGMWGVLDINVDTATKAATGGIVLRAFQDVDVGVRHGEAFAIEV